MKFSQILGQERAVARIRSMIDNDRLPHALLLHGEPGVPKLALAMAAAQYLHCTNRTGGDSCGVCPACLQHQSLNHADTFYSYPVIRRTSNPVSDDFADEWRDFVMTSDIVADDYQQWVQKISKDNAQPIIAKSESESIIRKMSTSAFTSKYKALIMWNADKMNDECQNKLLKLIEEPEEHVRFILTTDNVKEILPTIFSRTQRIELMKLSTEQIAEHLVQVKGISMPEALAVAAPADGNVIQAMRSMEEGSELHEFHSRFVELMRGAYSQDFEKLLNWSNAIADFKRGKSQNFLTYASRMVRENFVYNLNMPQLNYETEEEAQFSRNFARFVNSANVEGLMHTFDNAIRDIAGNANAKIVLFDTAIKVAQWIRVK